MKAVDGTEADVGAFDEFEHGRCKIIVFQKREVAIVRWNDEIFALRNVCPHQSESFANGMLHTKFDCGERVGELKLTNRLVLACPRHMWTFNVRDGRCTVDPQLRIRTYDVAIRNGRVLIADTPKGKAPAIV